MAQESSVGLKKIEIADVPATGLPTVWVELKAAEIGSATISETANTTTPIRIEQAPSSIYRNLTTDYGSATFAVRLFDVTADNLNKLKGGTVTPAAEGSGATWKKSRESVSLTQAVRLTTFDDFVIVMPKADVQALIDWPLTVGALGAVALTFTALLPDDAALSEIQISEPAA